VLLCASYKTTVEIYNLYWIYYANRGYLTVKNYKFLQSFYCLHRVTLTQGHSGVPE